MEYYWTIFLFAAFGRTHGDCGAPPRLQFGELDTQFIDQDNFSTGAAVTYKCRSGFTRAQGTNNSITCLSNSTWSTPEEFCTRRSCGNPGDLQHGTVSFPDTLFGARATYTCNLGYNMISRRNFRECQNDGTWSNEVPVCEVQTCPPPNAITDGSFSPDNEEYEYLNAVTYQCKDKTYALIGERTLSCTEHGNWSADPPQCKAVECSVPSVDNAEKVSGFSGPYHLNNAVEFRCLPGYTMVGSASVKCNVSSEWEPALPTCSRIVTQSPTTTEKETELGGSTTTQKPSTTKGKDENNGGSTVTKNTTKQKDETTGGGNNTGAVVGGVIAGIVGILVTAAVIYMCWYKKRKGDGYVGPTRNNVDGGTSSSHQTPIEQCDMKEIEAQETR
ncbi:membrane cofactor protein-like [Bufo bufo]|uniref:membrane cofactor protein-like n=1 Tax=Bufo bufo TaxID=8384 RepID=UPI001ABEB888|nr:membrane cofactor protein-like [Bufo bufo]